MHLHQLVSFLDDTFRLFPQKKCTFAPSNPTRYEKKSPYPSAAPCWLRDPFSTDHPDHSFPKPATEAESGPQWRDYPLFRLL